MKGTPDEWVDERAESCRSGVVSRREGNLNEEDVVSGTSLAAAAASVYRTAAGRGTGAAADSMGTCCDWIVPTHNHHPIHHDHPSEQRPPQCRSRTLKAAGKGKRKRRGEKKSWGKKKEIGGKKEEKKKKKKTKKKRKWKSESDRVERMRRSRHPSSSPHRNQGRPSSADQHHPPPPDADQNRLRESSNHSRGRANEDLPDHCRPVGK